MDANAGPAVDGPKVPAWQVIVDAVADGLSERDIARQHPAAWFAHASKIQRYISLVYDHPVRTDYPLTFWLWGETGIGKTRAAHLLASGTKTFVQWDRDGWWCGITPDVDSVIIDEFNSKVVDRYGQVDGRVSFTKLLGICDIAPCAVETKGVGAVTINPSLVVITSHHEPTTYFSQPDAQGRMDELERRIFSGGGAIMHGDEVAEFVETLVWNQEL